MGFKNIIFFCHLLCPKTLLVYLKTSLMTKSKSYMQNKILHLKMSKFLKIWITASVTKTHKSTKMHLCWHPVIFWCSHSMWSPWKIITYSLGGIYLDILVFGTEPYFRNSCSNHSKKLFCDFVPKWKVTGVEIIENESIKHWKKYDWQTLKCSKLFKM